MRVLRPRQKPEARLSITPMIDVVFLLLIFFMVGMKFRAFNRKLPAELPRAGKADFGHEVWVRIDDRNRGGGGEPSPRIAVDQVVMRGWDHTFSTLERLSRAPGALKDPVVLDPTDAAHTGWVLRIMDYLHLLGYSNINFRQ
ncbi:MAG: biopolymer transporter ExbD [Candidatus Brocadiae bacterium]|nr:biopolymer transporter ExbD [Candidatus Brocadiia bacterium]